MLRQETARARKGGNPKIIDISKTGIFEKLSKENI